MNTGQFLKCDADGCDHREDVEQLTADMVGKPCPKCGANLLTQEDFDKFEAMSAAFARFVTDLGGVSNPEPGQAGVLLTARLEDGEFTMKLKPVQAGE